MQFNKYMQKDRWVKHRKRQAMIERIKIAGIIIIFVAAYCLVGWIERGS